MCFSFWSSDLLFSDTQLVFVIGDLFGAGTETTTTTLRWALLYLLHNPDMLHRVKREVEEALGPSRMPSMKDKQHMPYTEAVLCEVQRMGDIVPLGVPHACTEDVTLRGYRIPKGTHFMTVLYAAHRDPNVWEDPYRFNPERFLDAEGKVCKDERLIPFSMGELKDGILFFVCCVVLTLTTCWFEIVAKWTTISATGGDRYVIPFI